MPSHSFSSSSAKWLQSVPDYHGTVLGIWHKTQTFFTETLKGEHGIFNVRNDLSLVSACIFFIVFIHFTQH